MLTVQSRARRLRQSQSHGRYCGQWQGSNRHEWSLKSRYELKAECPGVYTEQSLTGSRSQWVGCSKHGTACLDGVEALDHESADRTGGHELDESREEGLVLQVGVVFTRGKSERSGLNLSQKSGTYASRGERESHGPSLWPRS